MNWKDRHMHTVWMDYIQCLMNHSCLSSVSVLVWLNALTYNWADKMQQTFCCWGPLFVCPATLIYCLGCVLVAMFCHCKTAACGPQTERWCRLGRRTEVSDYDTLLSIQHSLWPLCSTKLADAEQVMWLTLTLLLSGFNTLHACNQRTTQ